MLLLYLLRFSAACSFVDIQSLVAQMLLPFSVLVVMQPSGFVH